MNLTQSVCSIINSFTSHICTQHMLKYQLFVNQCVNKYRLNKVTETQDIELFIDDYSLCDLHSI